MDLGSDMESPADLDMNLDMDSRTPVDCRCTVGSDLNDGTAVGFGLGSDLDTGLDSKQCLYFGRSSCSCRESHLRTHTHMLTRCCSLPRIMNLLFFPSSYMNSSV